MSENMERREVDVVTRTRNFVTLMLQRAVSEMAVEVCEQCGKCHASCPVSRHIESFNPRQLIAKVSLGRVEELLKSDVIWTCTSCLKCKERCPENISPYDVILILRNLAIRGGYDHPAEYDEFIDAVMEKGVLQQPQRVRTRSGERRDRASLGLPPAASPRDIKRFSEILRNIVRGGELV